MGRELPLRALSIVRGWVTEGLGENVTVTEKVIENSTLANLGRRRELI